MFWLFEDGRPSEWYEPYPGGYKRSIYPDGEFAFLKKLATPFTDQQGVVEYYITQVMSQYSGLPYQHWWRVADIT